MERKTQQNLCANIGEKKERKAYFPEKASSCSLEDPPSTAKTMTAKTALEMHLSEIFKRCFGSNFFILPFLIKSCSTGQTQREV